MASVLDKLRKSDLFFVFFFMLVVVAPVFLKMVLTGATGPTFRFYFFIVWIPVVTLLFAFLKGWQETSITGALLCIALLLSLASYPNDSLMDFRRQIVHQSYVYLITAAVTSVGLMIILRRRKLKRARPLISRI